MYENNKEGKRAYVNDLLRPMLINAGLGIKDVQYLDSETTSNTLPSLQQLYPEEVLVINANPDKSVMVNVSGDSISAMVCDVMKKVFELDYAREEESQIKEFKNFEDIREALRSCSTIHQLVKTIESFPHWSGAWYLSKLTDHSVIVTNRYFDAQLDDTYEEEEEFEFGDLVGGDNADFWPYIINVDRGDGEFEPLCSAPTERSAKQLASDLVKYFGVDIDASEVKYSCEDPEDPNPMNDRIIAKFEC